MKKQYIQRNNVMARKSAKPLEGFDNLLFTTKYGTPICNQILFDAIKRIIEEINLCRDELEQFEPFSPHCFRHTFATRCFEAGIQPKTVQTYLGHATLQMTMDLYTSVLEDHKQEEMQKLENVLNDVFECGESNIEEKFEQEQIKKNKFVPIRRLG